jgi:sporulation protein YtfJ
MEEHPIQGLMTTAMENLKDMIEVNTIIGDPVESPDGSVIIPVSKVGFGFAAGGTEFMPSGSSSSSQDDSGGSNSSEAVFPFGGGSGGGVSITPVAFLIVSPKGIKMVHLDESIHIYEKLIDAAPKAVEKIQQILKENGKGSKGESSKGKGKEIGKDQEQGKENEQEKDTGKEKDSENKKDEDKKSDKKKGSDDRGKSDADESPSIYDI